MGVICTDMPMLISTYSACHFSGELGLCPKRSVLSALTSVFCQTRQVRDIQNTFFLGLNSSAPTYLERYGAASDNPELDALPEDVQIMLGDKDTLLNALQVISSLCSIIVEVTTLTQAFAVYGRPSSQERFLDSTVAQLQQSL